MRRLTLALALVSAAAHAQTGAPPRPLDPPPPLEAGTVDGVVVDPAGAAGIDPAGDPPPMAGLPDEPAAPRDLVRLTYSPGAFAGSCPGVDDLKSRVRGHLGYDPFGEPAAKVALLLLDGADKPDRARIELLDPQLRSLGSRVIEANDGCDELVATAALQLSIALDPLAAPLSAAPQTTPAPTTPAPAPAPPPTTTPRSFSVAPTVIEEENIRFIMSLDGHVAMFLARGNPMFGLSIGAGVRGDLWSVRGEFRADFASDEDGNDGVTSIPLLVSALPCAHLPLGDDGDDGVFELVGCGTVTGGMMPVSGAVEGVGVYLGGGGRVGFDWRFADDTALRIFGQLEGAVLRASFTSGTNAFSESPVNFMIGIGGDLGDW